MTIQSRRSILLLGTLSISLLLGVIAACGTPVQTTGEDQSPTISDGQRTNSSATHLPTRFGSQVSSGEMALFHGLLHVDRSGCLVIGRGAGRSAIVWPKGSTAETSASGEVTVYDSRGVPLAKSGQMVTLGGGSAGPDATSAWAHLECVRGYAQVIVVDTVSTA